MARKNQRSENGRPMRARINSRDPREQQRALKYAARNPEGVAA